MSKIASTFRRFIKDESAATMVEYAIMVALIAVVAIVAVQTLGTTTNSTFTEVNSKLAP